MAENVRFRPLVTLGAVPPSSFGGTPVVPRLRPQAQAQPRPQPDAQVDGLQGFTRFPRPRGVGAAARPLLQITLPITSFLSQAEDETPAPIALRAIDITLIQRGQTINVTV